MITIESIKEEIRSLLVEKDGDLHAHELNSIVEEAKQIGLTDKQIAKLVPEVDKEINWEHIRKQKEEEKERLRKFEEEARRKEEEIKSTPEYIDSLIQYCLVDGVVESSELEIIFSKAIALKQESNALARRVKSILDKNKFKPFPNPNLALSSLKDTLCSTNWYNEPNYIKITTPPPPPPEPYPWRIVITSFLIVVLVSLRPE